jgi:uncharacterized protein YbjT (DUF2867 family)
MLHSCEHSLGHNMKKILIAGGSGFIGLALIESLLADQNNEIVALSRGARTSHHPRLSWKKCDLYSLKDISDAMRGCEVAYYLVHSMLPSASLSQGTFYDFDLIMADNFIRAAHSQNLQHIIYLGGMIPEGEELSWHLKSRLEVEETFVHSRIKTSVLRAGLIIGPQGSSFTILERLIRRLPIMICPAWTKTLSQPVALQDMVKALCRILNDEKIQGRVFDIAGPEVVSYQGLIQRAGEKIRKKSKLFTLNIIPLAMSRFWVSLVTGVPKKLVYPLVLSLKHKMLPSPNRQWPFLEDISTSLDDSLQISLLTPARESFTGFMPKEKDVRSIQRLVLPPGRSAEWVAEEYFKWLPTFFSTLIRVQLVGNRCTFYLIDPNLKLLILERSTERSTPDRQLLYIVGGLLSAKQERGRLEFREVLDRKYVMAAIHEFRPALPWFIYRWTQAVLHLFVMNAFGEHLKWYVISDQKVKV